MAKLHGERLELIASSSMFFREDSLSECLQRQERANNIPSTESFCFQLSSI